MALTQTSITKIISTVNLLDAATLGGAYDKGKFSTVGLQGHVI